MASEKIIRDKSALFVRKLLLVQKSGDFSLLSAGLSYWPLVSIHYKEKHKSSV